jgi:ribonuclease-3
VQVLRNLFKKADDSSFEKQLKNVLGIKSGNILLYRTAMSHRSVKETPMRTMKGWNTWVMPF